MIVDFRKLYVFKVIQERPEQLLEMIRFACKIDRLEVFDGEDLGMLILGGISTRILFRLK
jgi:hypothetical protein